MSSATDSKGELAFRNYQEVLPKVRRMKEAEFRGTGAPSDYWRKELEALDYMLEASPLILRKLLRHAHQFNGVWIHEYRDYFRARKESFRRRIEKLNALGGRDVPVSEPADLGGFGFEIDGRRYNMETLRYFEVLTGMKRAGIIDELRAARRRKTVWEIGSGFGGFAYQFKTLFPDTCYIMVDLPEMFVFSGVYLKTMFPSAKARFYGDMPDSELTSGLEDVDFVFIPNTRLEALKPTTLDLTVNMASFMEMTTDQVQAYAGTAARLGCPILYSFNRDRSPYNEQLSGVEEILSSHFSVEEIKMLNTEYTFAMGGAGRSALGVWKRKLKHLFGLGGKVDFLYRHLVGRRKS